MSALWAITCFFNPAGYSRRLQNYRWFRDRLTTPLVTVELSFNGEFALKPADADILVQLDQGDILFQKERLLNIALEQVPAACQAIAWIDCDVIFGSNDWPVRTLEALERFVMVQPFRERYDLLPDSRPEETATWSMPPDRLSLMAKIGQEGITAADFQRERPPSLGIPAWGLAWAARKEVLDKHGFYDGCVLTGGDVAIFCAGIGAMDGQFMRDRMNAPSLQHYLSGPDPFTMPFEATSASWMSPLFHLWHGSIAERRYSACLTELKDMGFDPYTDIAKTDQATWRWSSHKPELHAHVRKYFWTRNEDSECEVGAETRQGSA